MFQKKPLKKIFSFLLIVVAFSSCANKEQSERKTVVTAEKSDAKRVEISSSKVYTTNSASDVKLQLTSEDVRFQTLFNH